jgi:hypothetical protein
MEKTYGSEKKAEHVFYASKNAGKITGIDAADAERIGFQSSGAQRGEFKGASKTTTAPLSAEQRAEWQRRAAEEMAAAERKYGKPRDLASSAGGGIGERIGFKSLGTKKDDDACMRGDVGKITPSVTSLEYLAPKKTSAKPNMAQLREQLLQAERERERNIPENTRDDDIRDIRDRVIDACSRSLADSFVGIERASKRMDAAFSESDHPRDEEGKFSESGTSKHEIDPDNLVFREEMQNRTEETKERFPEGEGYPAIVTIHKDGEEHILDGHNRAAVAKERGEKIQAVSITDDEYEKLKVDFDDMEIAYAALEFSGEEEAASDLDRQFSSSVAKRGQKALSALDKLRSA